jgi:hypothetical protein
MRRYVFFTFAIAVSLLVWLFYPGIPIRGLQPFLSIETVLNAERFGLTLIVFWQLWLQGEVASAHPREPTPSSSLHEGHDWARRAEFGFLVAAGGLVVLFVEPALHSWPSFAINRYFLALLGFALLAAGHVTIALAALKGEDLGPRPQAQAIPTELAF